MEHDEEVIREHTKKLEQIDQHAEELKKGTAKFEQIDQRTEKIERRTKKIRDEQKDLKKHILDLEKSIGEKKLTNGFTAEKIDKLEEENKSVHQKLDDIIEAIGYTKGQKDAKKEGLTFFQKILAIIFGATTIILGILELTGIL